MKLRFSHRLLLRHLGAGVVLLSLAIVVFGIITEPASDDVDVGDVIFEGAVLLLVVVWYFIVRRTADVSRIHVPLAVGLALIFGAYFKDLADEFTDLGAAFDLVEKLGSVGGMAMATIGLTNWARDFADSRDRLEALVAQKTSELVESNKQLSTALAAKDLLLKEIHHRVKNNLQIMDSLISLEAYHSVNEGDREVLPKLRKRIQAIAAVHDLLYQNDNTVDIKMPEYIHQLVQGLASAYSIGPRGVDISGKSDDFSLNSEQAVLCGLLINEIASNAVNHGFPGDRSGRVHTSAVAVGDTVTLEVSDDGVGLPESVDVANPNSLGYKLINAWARQLNAALSVSRDKGTNIRIEFEKV